MSVRDLLFSANVQELSKVLKTNPDLASEEIPLPDNPAKAAPLHRICDGVFEKHYSEETGLELARIFLQNGADMNPKVQEKQDSPLTAACSLGCDQIAILYIQNGANIHHKGCFGGTAPHWASWCGRDVVVRKLLTMDPNLNQLCIEYKATPLFWAIHGYKFGGKDNQNHQVECARMLLEKGADPTIQNFEGLRPAQLLDEKDKELLHILN